MLFIEQADPSAERWTGKMVTVPEAKEISGIEDVRFIDRFEPLLQYMLNGNDFKACYFDCHRNRLSDLPDYNLVKAQQFQKDFPGITVRNIWRTVAVLRMQKDSDEVAKISQAIEVTRQGLEAVMSTLTPGMKEYQAQAKLRARAVLPGHGGSLLPHHRRKRQKRLYAAL